MFNIFSKKKKPLREKLNNMYETVVVFKKFWFNNIKYSVSFIEQTSKFQLPYENLTFL